MIPIPFADGSTHYTTSLREEIQLTGGPGRWVGDGAFAAWEPPMFRIKWQDQNWWIRHDPEFHHYSFGGWLHAQPIGFIIGQDMVLRIYDCTREPPGPNHVEGIDG